MKKKPTLRILMITHKTESFVRDIARFICKKGHEVILYGPIPAKKDLKHLISDGVKFIPIKIKGVMTSGEKIDDLFLQAPRFEMIKYVLTSLRDLASIILNHKINMLHAHWVLPSGFIAGLLSRIFRVPAIITAHGRSIYLNPEVGFTIPRKFYARILLKIAFRNMKRLVVISEDARAHALARGASPHKINLIYNGTDDHLFDSRLPGAVIRERLESKDSYILMAVRKFHKRKGLQYAIKALPRVLQSIPNTRLILIGGGPLDPALRKLAERLNVGKNVIFTGMIPNVEVPLYLAAADVCLIPSLDEGFGVAAVESMAMKKPLISTMAGGLKEVVDESVAVIVPAKDANAISEAIIKLWKDPNLRKRMGELGREKVETIYNWDRAAGEYINLYHKVL